MQEPALPFAHNTRQHRTVGLALTIQLSSYKADIGEDSAT